MAAGKPPKQRLDLLIVQRQLSLDPSGPLSRQQAQRLIQAGQVRVNQQIIDKPGTLISPQAAIEIKQRPPYVSRGGEKLAGALAKFPIGLEGRICLDAGISTGGFTDCLLQAGARRVYGIDVGYGQVDWGLRQNPRLILKERTNIRYLQPRDLYQPDDPWPNLAVADVSFISLTKILPALVNLLIAPKELLLLVKPQFEVGRELVGKSGVVKDVQAQATAIQKVLEASEHLGWLAQGLTPSPLLGPAGNREFFLWLNTHSSTQTPAPIQIEQICQQTASGELFSSRWQ
ncbi:TlyA family RNA methyltransferase [Thermosynechococcaceae cyanobacterium BACA0444]|uniref:TlyA family RNA methyltransferase n=1 Tax=Pseudocalidococcus azoricus BACA0444 TaxID=2918990 RepID=A0AAE4JVQ7_9CYAN|nr:TlyA family RNA methyltransferase [Pseudocalidococcus azoricus]MDS3859318.1 TlyA family RNA methyltransferase [Pseudocalidococcus azoricus BACA0444]